MTQELVAIQGPVAAPKGYQLAGGEAFIPKSAYAVFDGTAAAGAFLPCCTIYSQDGRVLSRTFPGQVAAGDVAGVTYGPFLKAPVSVGAAATPPTGPGGSTWITGGYVGLVLVTKGLLNLYRLTNAPPRTYLTDSYGGLFPTPLIETVGAAPGVAILQDQAGPPAPKITDDAATAQLAQNPNNGGFDSFGTYYAISNAGNNQVTKWGAGAITVFSWECWIKPDAGQPNITGVVPPDGPIIDAYTADLFNPVGCYLAADYSPSGPNPFVRFVQAQGFELDSPALPANTWHHIVVTADGAGGETVLYVDGVAVARNTALAAQANQAVTWKIGAGKRVYTTTGFISWRTFDGTIAEVALYNRALSAAEVLLHYNATGPSTDPGRWITVPFGAGALVGDKTIDTPQIADQAVTTAKIRDSAVTSAKIADATIVAADISATLKPSGTAAAGTEALRALGITATTAVAGLDTRLFAKTTPAYSASITPNWLLGTWQTITVTNATPFAVNAPTNPPAATGTGELTIEILNSSGGAMGAVAWNAALVLVGGAFVNPANGKRRFVRFQWNGTVWVETGRASADY